MSIIVITKGAIPELYVKIFRIAYKDHEPGPWPQSCELEENWFREGNGPPVNCGRGANDNSVCNILEERFIPVFPGEQKTVGECPRDVLVGTFPDGGVFSLRKDDIWRTTNEKL